MNPQTREPLTEIVRKAKTDLSASVDELFTDLNLSVCIDTLLTASYGTFCTNIGAIADQTDQNAGQYKVKQSHLTDLHNSLKLASHLVKVHSAYTRFESLIELMSMPALQAKASTSQEGDST